MDDIDRTYHKLRKKPLIEVLRDLRDQGKITCSVNPNTFAPIATVESDDLADYGWSINDVDGRTEFEFGYKVLLAEWMK